MKIFQFFHDQGLMYLTLGSKGEIISKGKDIIQMPAIKIDKVMDSWQVMLLVWILFAFIKESINECLDIALKLAALKLQNVGRLPDNINILSKLL
jgi:fructokinase